MTLTVQAMGNAKSAASGSSRRGLDDRVSQPARAPSAQALLALHRALTLIGSAPPASPAGERIGAAYRLEQPAALLLDVRA